MISSKSEYFSGYRDLGTKEAFDSDIELRNVLPGEMLSFLGLDITAQLALDLYGFVW